MISVIVPIYNVQPYITKCLDSLVAQTCQDLQFVLVDDGSPDDCPKICDEYAKKDSRFTVVHKQNGGLISARQAGLKAAKGEYIGFVDGDDWIESDMFEKLNNALIKHNSDMAICQFYYSYEDREEKSEYSLNKEFYTKEEIKNTILDTMLFNGRYYSFGIYPNCWSKVFKKELLEKNLTPVNQLTTMGEDTSFTYPCLIDANSICFVDEALYYYRISQQSMTKKYDSKLKDVILLPYNVLKSNDYDLSYQLNYYLLYMLNFVVRNEANKSNSNTPSQSKAVLNLFTKNKQIQSAIKATDFKILPMQTKIVRFCLANGFTNLLYLYTKVLSRFM